MTSIGVSTWVWTSPLDDDRLRELAPRIAAWGFDLVELPVEAIGGWDPIVTASLLADLGLGATVCAVMSDERDLTTDDLSVIASTQAYLRECIDAAATVGAPVVAGPIYAPVGRVLRQDEAGRAATVGRLVEALRPVVDHAGASGVRLALEPLNRYETSLINTIDQAMDVVEAVDSPALGVCLDTFHLNIEERDPAASTRRVGDRIAHVQACGTDRGAPGQDQFDWAGFAAALTTCAYAGAVCIESFTSENAAIARAASIWRPLAVSQDQLAIDGIAFLRRIFAGRERPGVRAADA
jgi:D-psicose/D-tagatose/L-ribulose 3-epimerase